MKEISIKSIWQTRYKIDNIKVSLWIKILEAWKELGPEVIPIVHRYKLDVIHVS